MGGTGLTLDENLAARARQHAADVGSQLRTKVRVQRGELPCPRTSAQSSN
jgi:hypothetical protein